MRAALLALPLLLILAVSSAYARATLDVALPLERAFSGAVRFVRVDRGCKITDKDESSAYIVFECPDGDGGSKQRRGSLELFANEGKAVRIQVSLPDEPHYAELRFVELLERKLRDEYGSTRPLPQRPTPTKPAPPDGGAP